MPPFLLHTNHLSFLLFHAPIPHQIEIWERAFERHKENQEKISWFFLVVNINLQDSIQGCFKWYQVKWSNSIQRMRPARELVPQKLWSSDQDISVWISVEIGYLHSYDSNPRYLQDPIQQRREKRSDIPSSYCLWFQIYVHKFIYIC